MTAENTGSVLYVRSELGAVSVEGGDQSNRSVGAALSPSTSYKKYLRANARAMTDRQEGAQRLDTLGYHAERMIPEDLYAVLSRVRHLLTRLGQSVQVVGLSHWEHLELQREAQRKGWTRFPVLVGPGGGALVGYETFTDASVREVLAGGTSALSESEAPLCSKRAPG